MVSVHKESRGKGLGAVLNQLALAALYKEGCTYVGLTTDEFRVPAVKSYLRAGFRPVLYEEDMESRWVFWLNRYGYMNIDAYDNDNNFVKNLCDSEELDFIKKRGNADIPFALKCCVEEWLLKRCLKHNMPELRWYYEIFRNDVKGSENAIEFLQEAYQSSKCDEKTVNLLLNSELDFLGWGAHHFPQGCIIDDNARKQSFERCFEIIKNKKADKKLIEELRYYEKLYSSYDKYVSDGRIKNFEEYL
jgi:hypothetical protein